MHQYMFWVNKFVLNSSNVYISYWVLLITSTSTDILDKKNIKKNKTGKNDETETQAIISMVLQEQHVLITAPQKRIRYMLCEKQRGTTVCIVIFTKLHVSFTQYLGFIKFEQKITKALKK